MGTDFRPPVVFFVPGSGEGAERIGGRAVRVRRRVTERGRERSGWAASCAVCVRSRSLDGWRPAARPMLWPGCSADAVARRGRAAGARRRAIRYFAGAGGPEGLEGPGVVLSCNLPGQAMQRIPPVYYLCR